MRLFYIFKNNELTTAAIFCIIHNGKLRIGYFNFRLNINIAEYGVK